MRIPVNKRSINITKKTFDHVFMGFAAYLIIIVVSGVYCMYVYVGVVSYKFYLASIIIISQVCHNSFQVCLSHLLSPHLFMPNKCLWILCSWFTHSPIIFRSSNNDMIKRELATLKSIMIFISLHIKVFKVTAVTTHCTMIIYYICTILQQSKAKPICN